ncbi:TPA: oligosaccharide flippase family protein [Candidatus Ventrenecus avicola]|nr:oligosaccharide flippase family protein [Candidatus Ventrenecus avicola]
MNRNKEFAINTFILFLGKFTTQFITFLLIPLYTHFLNADDYGLIDLIQTYVSLFVPVLILRFDSAVFRFLIDERKNKDNVDGKKIVITNIVITVFCVAVVVSFIYILIGFFVSIKYFWLLLFTVIAIMFSNILLQISRGLGKNKEYSIACVITGITTLILNVIFIIIFKMGASSILVSTCIANVLCSMYIALKNKIFNMIELRFLSKKRILEYLKYSLPMIPNSLSWWIVNVSDRSIITFILGTAMNGIYTISCKFSNIINSIFSIFNMSWQESASMHINDNDNDKDIFFTTIINKMLDLFSTVSVIIIATLPLVYNYIVGSNYIESYFYIPILLFANMFNILINLIGGIYIAKKETKKIMNTTIVSAIINLIFNLSLIKTIGLYAACLSTLFAYFIMAVYRYIDVQKYVRIKINFLFSLRVILIFIITCLLYYINIPPINILNFMIVVVYVIVFNRKSFKQLVGLIKR